ncbi:MAG: cobaltochelatase subunit CobT [Acetobacter fabarum]|jgi:cobaltochelatase CobT|uniref:Cobaltochelatase subunit CobT n=1 Tax=Acetobacter fabarum TaxID=483199 RepID=A0A269Y133_9PROT|nr:MULTISPECIES: cobaltochelatase subunit CobT [Acetobacter]MCH4026779.1 cobaltochelatase subunit CobT [Acetobacter fabarum]MCH4056159.1 cobaltochelatase subunit CobT [Acetobacter fabarum]MCH4085360.1 cobaltochelatase subunit CobT [Acetobacter fabarum]MCH4127096.1 cobaltochelatase subunit CobT [Acetobacter fabarum]MCH4137397.1 cobaltochelatase subunit CobT [Acetobacter fabarum]
MADQANNTGNPSIRLSREEAEKRADAFKQATEATLRALGGRKETNVSFHSGNMPMAPISLGEKIRLSSPSLNLNEEEAQRLRGAADAQALRLKHHDFDLHAARRPADTIAREVYDALEQARVEAVGARHMKGVAANLRHRLEQEIRAAGLDHMTDAAQLSPVVGLELLAREKLTGEPLPESARAIMEQWKQSLPEDALAALDTLAADQDSQKAYSRAARKLLAACALTDDDSLSDQEEEDENSGNAPDTNEDESEQPPPEQEDETSGAAPDMSDAVSEPQLMAGSADAADNTPEVEQESGSAEGTGDAAGPGNRKEIEPGQTAKGYHAYTTSFDEEILAENLCDPEELSRLRHQLDLQLATLHGVVSRLANRLQRRLMAQQTRSWSFDLEEGMLDAGRLSRIVVNPRLSLSYKQEKDTEFRDTVVTLLIDNSGSMRGRPISVAASCGDILARTLERCGVKVEILGFTTRAWKGGQSRELWVQNNKPENPGRLNDLRHIVYKGADTPWRRARTNLGLMLREGLLKENIDGEALLWAWRRIKSRPEARKILMVISDGAPVDDSTLSVNPASYLEDHLREVIGMIENRSPVELSAIGIGHDVTRYYQRAVTITDAEELGGTMLQSLSALFDEKRMRKRA